MDRNIDFPLTSKQFRIIVMEKNRKYPLLWRKNIHIHEHNRELISKKYSLPFWPKSLKNEITEIVSSENNGNTKLSFIFQLNLEDFHFPDLPRQGLIQFYCASNQNRANDSNENDKYILEKIANFKSSGAYQIIYIAPKHFNEDPVSVEDILQSISPYKDGEMPHSLKFKQDCFELGLLHNSMYHILYDNNEDTSTIEETFGEYVQRKNPFEINQELNQLFENEAEHFIDVQQTMFNPKLKFSHGNKTGGFPVYLEKDNRNKNKTKFDFLLFQIDTRVFETSEGDEVDEHENMHKIIQNTPEYVMGLNVSKEQLKKWMKTPTLNFKQSIDTLFHKQYM